MDDRFFEIILDLTRARAREKYPLGERTSLRVLKVDDLNAALKMQIGSRSAPEINVDHNLAFKYGIEDGEPLYFDELYFSNDIGTGEARILVAKNVDLTRDINVSPNLALEGIRAQVVTVTETATKIPTTPLSNRKVIGVQNNSGKTVYLGGSGVTSTGATQGFVLRDGDFKAYEISEVVDLYGLVAAGDTSAALNIEELA